MKIDRFEDIIAWQKSKELVLSLYGCFHACIDHGFKNQIQRACVSIMNNIAEGYERKSNKEFARFLYMAKGSSAEVRSMLYLALELRYMRRLDFEKNYQLALEISKIISGLIKTL